MGAAAITPLVLSTIDSTSQKKLTWAVVDSATGAYIDLTGYKGDKLIIAVRKSASNVAGTTATQITIQNCTVQKFSGYTLGDLNIRGTSNVALAAFGEFCGPFETARFKDSNERINIKCTAGTNVGYLSAILI